MGRPMTIRTRPRLIALVSFALISGGCSVSPASLGPTGAAGATASPTSGPQVTAADDIVVPTSSASVGEPGAEVGWSRVVAPFGDPSVATRIDGVVEWRSGLVAFGRVKAPGRNQFNELSAVFLSDTGETWRGVPIDVGVGPEDGSEIYLLAAGPRGIVAFGGTCCAVEEQAIWFSTDGGAWERVAPEPSVFDGSQLTVARATETGFVAAGSRSGRAAIWTSSDGRAWAAVGSADAELGKGAIGDLAPVSGRWLAAGVQDDGDTYDGALWESADGVDWKPVPPDPLFRGELDTVFGRLSSTSDGILLIGNEGPHDERVRCDELLGPAARLAPAGLLASAGLLPSGGSRDPALSCGWGLETHWWSRDGQSWERLPSLFPLPGEPPLTDPGPIEFRLITSGGPGLLNLGEDRLGGVRLWGSRDGREWVEQDSADILRSGQDMASGIAVLNGRVIAVGDAWDGSPSKPGEPAVWIGPEL